MPSQAPEPPAAEAAAEPPPPEAVADPADELPPGMTLMDAATCAAPHGMYASLREESPVLRLGNMVVASRRAEVEEILRCPVPYSSAEASQITSLGNVRPLIPLQVDPPDHVRYRRILDQLFAPKRMARLEGSVTDLVRAHIDKFAARGSCDLVAEFTVPFPSEVFLTLLGLPLEDLPDFLSMKDGIIRPPGSTLGELSATRNQAGSRIYEYFEGEIEKRAGQAPRDDLLGGFLTPGPDGTQLSHEEILDICFLFLIAGLDTVSASLDCMFAYLAQHPEDRRLLASDPSVIPSAVEELLRWETPVMGVARGASEDAVLGGEPVHPGDSITVLLGSANVEPGGRVEDPESVDLRREVNPHLAFGAGVHRCLGSHLARLELRVALREFHARIPDYQLEEGAELVYSQGIRSIERLPLVYPPA